MLSKQKTTHVIDHKYLLGKLIKNQQKVKPFQSQLVSFTHNVYHFLTMFVFVSAATHSDELVHAN